MIRSRCAKRGHKFRDYSTMRLPYVYCARWGCTVSAVAAWVDPRLAPDLHNAIPLEQRFPPVTLDRNGQVLA